MEYFFNTSNTPNYQPVQSQLDTVARFFTLVNTNCTMRLDMIQAVIPRNRITVGQIGVSATHPSTGERSVRGVFVLFKKVFLVRTVFSTKNL